VAGQRILTALDRPWVNALRLSRGRIATAYQTRHAGPTSTNLGRASSICVFRRIVLSAFPLSSGFSIDGNVGRSVTEYDWRIGLTANSALQ